jgi:hypothetical protein
LLLKKLRIDLFRAAAALWSRQAVRSILPPDSCRLIVILVADQTPDSCRQRLTGGR